MIGRVLGVLGRVVLAGVIAVSLAVALIPPFLDALYYRGPVSGHFDGARFFNPDPDDAIDALGTPAPTGSRYFWRRLSGGQAQPDWPATVAVARRPVAPRVDGDAMVVTWVGHATFLVQTRGLNILTDPIWSERAGPFGIGPARVARPGIDFDALPPIDLVLVSHNHYDHMDLTTLRRLWARDKPLIVTSLGNDSVIGQVGVPARALDWGGRIAVRPGIDVVVNRNHHWGSRWFADKNRALWSSFVVRLPGGNLFFAGDTGAGDLRWADAAARLGPVRLALIPIGAFRFYPGQMSNWSHIGPVDAVEVARRLGAARSIGMHWGTFRLSSEAYDTPPRLLAAAMRCTGQGGRFDTVALGVPTVIARYAAPAPRPPMTRSALLRCLDTPAVRALR